MGKLTVLGVRAMTAPGRYSDGGGLMLLVKPSGSRSWLLRIQADGKRRDLGLGSAADVSLAEAREKAGETRKQLRNGIDPVEAKRVSRRLAAGIPTFREAAETAHRDQKAGWRNKKHQDQWLSSLKSYAFPKIGDVRIDKLDASAIRDVLLPIWLEKPETARRVKQRVGTVLDWAYSAGHRETEAPMRAIGKGLPRQPKKDGHFTAMPYADVPALASKLAKANTSGRLALRFAILTAARSGEARGATWEEIDWDQGTWTIPASRMKAGREHIVPLAPAALAVLKVAQAGRTGGLNEPVFPGLRGGVLSDMTMSKALRIATTQAATVHGFRSSFRDWAAEQTAFAGDVVEAALAHTIANRVEAAYRRTNYLEKRRPLMEAWAEYVATGPEALSAAA
ncbi:MAG: integrase [Sphingomonas bacterium]|uniref:tyrosine-type recombinase/integrase n=1 Tax=Sphingomonas bacterium TaxID=1895847 RepID=UPI00262B0CA6|nr:integrase arm-type DNA-binding domain-containing protein [Sphingomonas bacterium]MDB5704537.1 integrase [Sphingomonas bacterium]